MCLICLKKNLMPIDSRTRLLSGVHIDLNFYSRKRKSSKEVLHIRWRYGRLFIDNSL